MSRSLSVRNRNQTSSGMDDVSSGSSGIPSSPVFRVVTVHVSPRAWRLAVKVVSKWSRAA